MSGREAPAAPLLEVEGLRVAFSTRRGRVEAVRDVSVSLAPGETLGVVGESGSGKSVTAYAVMGLLDRAGRVEAGRIRYRGEDVTRAPRARMRDLRGAEISMIFQNARAALNPIRAVGEQIADALQAHEALSRADARARALELLETVRIRDAAARMAAYPHELSGGMCQRVMIALALACSPDLLIADEPTTGLDVTTQKTIMDLVADLTRARGMAVILITHDLGLAARYCGDIVVMEKGEVVERAPTERLFGAPEHPYTRRLVAATPRRDSTIASLTEGAAPAEGAVGAPAVPPASLPAAARGRPLLEVAGLRKEYPGATAVDGVDFELRAGESLGLVGESGSGKTTVSRMVARLIDPTSGEIWFDGARIDDQAAARFHRHPLRRDIQIVFQDPTDSLNPRFSAADCILDPLRRLGARGGRGAAGPRAEAEALAARVGLPAELLDRFPHQLSGGQKARVGIARALAVSPRLLVLDEPTAALDVSVQAVVLGLLDRLRREDGLSYLFVSHDLNVVRMLCERVLVMRAGEIVEAGPSAELLARPRSPYTAELVEAIPEFRPRSPRPAA